jgi:hypothetical protein
MVANQGARRLRACILGIIPGDVIEEAVKQCEATMNMRAQVTPERTASLLEKFAEFKVTKAQIEKRIQRHLDALTPALMVNLGKIYNSLKDGMSGPSDWFEVASDTGVRTLDPSGGKVVEPEVVFPPPQGKENAPGPEAKQEPPPEVEAAGHGDGLFGKPPEKDEEREKYLAELEFYKGAFKQRSIFGRVLMAKFGTTDPMEVPREKWDFVIGVLKERLDTENSK